MWYNLQGSLQRRKTVLVLHGWSAAKVKDLQSSLQHPDLDFLSYLYLINLILNVYALCKSKATAEEAWRRYLWGHKHPHLQGPGHQNNHP